MEIGLIHLTDLHLESDTVLTEKTNSLCAVINNELSNVVKKYLIISGDIVNRGNKEQYINAKQVFKEIINKTSIDKIIIAPGNHDCNFNYDNQIRRISITNIDYDNLGDDGSIIEQAIKVQKDFWEFYEEFNEIPKNKLVYQISDNIQGKKISFKCFNTAWMSSKNEQVGTLFFPVSIIENIENLDDISIAIFHHPTNWFSPNKKANNRNEFQDYLDSVSNIKLIGHEHENRSIFRTNLDTKTNALEFYGEIFNDNKSSHSGFQIIKINSKENKLILKKYVWENDIYIENTNDEMQLQKASKRKLRINQNFWNELDDIKIPLQIDGKMIQLSRIYVYPDLEEKKEDYKELDSYIDAKKLIDREKFYKVVLDGDSQIGKSSLLSMLFKEFYNSGYYPFFIERRRYQ